MEREELSYFKRNVNYTVGVRYFIRDVIGKALTGDDPYIAIKESQLRDFKRANRRHLMEGLIIPTSEPELDEATPNAVTDEQATAIVKNVFTLKKVLSELTSDVPVIKLLDEAKLQKRPVKTIELIEGRLKELVGETVDEMQGELDK